MITTYGYARASTVQQDLTLQIESLLQLGISSDDIYVDNLNDNKNMEQQQIQKLLVKVQEGDLIIVKKLDRLGKSVSQVTSVMEELNKKGIHVKSIEDNIDTSNSTEMTRAIMQLLPIFADMERNFILERTKPAIEKAKKNGVKFGRPKTNQHIYELAVREYLSEEMTSKEIINKYGKDTHGKDIITEATLFRRVREYRKKQEELKKTTS